MVVVNKITSTIIKRKSRNNYKIKSAICTFSIVIFVFQLITLFYCFKSRWYELKNILSKPSKCLGAFLHFYREFYKSQINVNFLTWLGTDIFFITFHPIYFLKTNFVKNIFVYSKFKLFPRNRNIGQPHSGLKNKREFLSFKNAQKY